MSYTPHTKDQRLTLMMATLGTDAQPTAEMAARVREARVTLLPCRECGELHAAARLDGSTGLCEKCYDLAGMENEHSDGHHDGKPNRDCPNCQPEPEPVWDAPQGVRIADAQGNVKTSTLPQRHDCEVASRPAGPLYVRHERTEFFAVCDICGPVGQPQARHTDAAAIAVRHFEQGGFERRGA